jgi:hypothetical protein
MELDLLAPHFCGENGASSERKHQEIDRATMGKSEHGPTVARVLPADDRVFDREVDVGAREVRARAP